MSKVTFYGADWCSDCRRSKSLLNTLGVDFEMKDVEQSAELAAESESISRRKKNTVIFTVYLLFFGLFVLGPKILMG